MPGVKWMKLTMDDGAMNENGAMDEFGGEWMKN